MKQKVIAFLTDFGDKDTYVAQMKAVILSINPQVNFVDLTHYVEPGDTREAAFALCCAYHFFPQGTIFVNVVDPGVGTQRKALAVKTKNFYFLCPDNGILSYVLEEEKMFKAVELTNKKYQLYPVNSTFHGRDIFSPAAAYLSKKVSLEKFGPEVREIVRFPGLQPKLKANKIIAQIISADRFGNMITSLKIDFFKKNKASFKDYKVLLGDKELEIVDAYADVPKGQTLAIFGGNGYLEIAVNCGNAQRSLKLKKNSEIMLVEK